MTTGKLRLRYLVFLCEHRAFSTFGGIHAEAFYKTPDKYDTILVEKASSEEANTCAEIYHALARYMARV